MYIPSPASKTPRFFQPCPGNDEYQLEPGMFGIKDVSGGSEAWYRPFKTLVGDANPDPILIATAADVANMVLKSTFDANTVLKADADNTPVALPVGASTILGRASTGGIAALTAAQVAAIINSSIAHNSTSGLNTGDYQHVNPSPAAGVDGWSVAESDYFTGGTKSASVRSIGATQLNSNTLSYGTTNKVISGRKYLSVSRDIAGTVICDRNTLQELWTTINTPAFTVGIFITDEIIIRGTTNTISYIDIVNDTVSTKTATGLANVRDFWMHPDCDKVYTVDESGDLFYWSIESESLTLVSAVTGLTGVVVSVDSDNSGFIYVLDGPTGAGNSYVRKINITTGAITASSPAMPIVSGGIYGDCIKIIGNYIYVSSSISATQTKKIYTLNLSDLSIANTDAGTVTTFRGMIYDGVLYGSNAASSLVSNTLPSLTLTAPRAADFTKADSFRIAAPGITGVYAASDLIRNGVLQSGALWRDRLGVSVTSVETALPASPVDGALYLISGGTSVHEGTVAEYIAALGWAIHAPEHGSKVTSGYFTYTYNINQWEKRFELVYSTTLTISNGVADPSTTVYIPGLTQSGEVITVDHASMMAFQQASNGRFAILREMMIGYHGVIMSTARKEMESLGSGITASDFYAEAGNPSSGDLNLIFELTGTPIYDAVYNVTFRISGSIQTGVADFCS